VLIEFALPGIASCEVGDIIAHRCRRPPTLQSILAEEDQDLVEEFMGGDAPAIIEHVVEAAAKRKRTTTSPGLPSDGGAPPKPDGATCPDAREGDTCPLADPEAGPSGAAGSAASSSAGVGVPVVLRRIESKMWTQEQAKALCPTARGVTISMHTGTRWIIKYPARAKYPKSNSQTWGGDQTHMQALSKCLQWAWDIHHNECGGPACPYDLHEHLGV
jgi:hypothetical protein